MDKWNRLEAVIRWTGMSVNAFALHIGLKRSENLYQIKKGNNGISSDLADLITTKYPQVSKAWLLTGEGEMFLSDRVQHITGRAVPFYESDSVLADPGRLKEAKPAYYLALPDFNDCDLAVAWNGDSMEPAIPAGSKIMLKRTEGRNILFGGTYLVVTREFTVVRDLRRVPEDEERVRLVPRNTENYDDLVVDREDIKAIYSVKGIVYKLT